MINIIKSKKKLLLILIFFIFISFFYLLFLKPINYTIKVNNKSDTIIDSITLYYERKSTNERYPIYFELFSAIDVTPNNIIKKDLKLLDTNNVYVEYMVKINFNINGKDITYDLYYIGVPSYLTDAKIIIYNDDHNLKADIEYRGTFFVANRKNRFTKILE